VSDCPPTIRPLRGLGRAADFASILRFGVFRGGAGPRSRKRTTGRSDYKLHRGDRSNDLKTLPMASCRQCQTSALAFGGSWPALFFDSLLLVCRRGDATGITVALASRQCPLAVFLMVSGLVDGVSAGVVLVAGATISVFAGVPGSSSLSLFADSFSANAGSILL
jgi:hypothetical protein